MQGFQYPQDNVRKILPIFFVGIADILLPAPAAVHSRAARVSMHEDGPSRTR